MTGSIEVATNGAIQTLRLARPKKKNALTSPMYAALATALEHGESSPEIAVHVLLGQPGVFSAGNDIGEFKAYAEGGGLGPEVVRFLKCLARLEKPLVAGVDGLALGIGTTLLLHCDLVYASAASTFQTPFLRLGLLPEAASSLLAPRLLGHALAFELLCLGESFSAEKAFRAGLVNDVVAAEAVEDRATAAATVLAGKPRQALLAARRLLRGDPAEVLARIDTEARLFADRLRSEEARAAFEAFFHRRPAAGKEPA